jgi:Arsenical resistance operon trans-acting repressor ArsD.
MKEMQIFEPALCCETGICGASVDPELLRITTVIDRLKQNGIIVKRFNYIIFDNGSDRAYPENAPASFRMEQFHQ